MDARRIVLGVTGSIAAYKAACLASSMVQAGLDVRAVLTDGAHRFIAPLTFEALTGRPALTSLWSESRTESAMAHLDLATWADALVVAPASADALSRLAHGRANDLLSAMALSFHGPLLLAPAMETAMFLHPATQDNLRMLRARGAIVVGPETGRLASGASGSGRMSDPEDIFRSLRYVLAAGQELADRRVVVTAGPTYEPIDPVRFIGNYSSGKMGYAVAEEAVRRGAAVDLISGPTSLSAPSGVSLHRVSTASQMRAAVLEHAVGADIVVMSAAVADFRPATAARTKLKRSDHLHLDLVATEDIAAETARRFPEALHVGFALETDDLVGAAREKLARKGQSLVVANAVTPTHNPFGSDTNRVLFVTADSVQELEQTSKQQVAAALWDAVRRLMPAE